MTSSPDESAILFSRMVAAASTALLMVFSLTILASILPIRVTDPAWQFGLTTTIVNNGGFALIGLLLLHLAAYLDPANRRWEARAATFRQLAILATIGFLLLVPLHGVATWKGLTNADASHTLQEQQLLRRFVALRQAIRTAPTTGELQSRLEQLQGPALKQVDLSQPLPQLRKQLLIALEQAEASVRSRLPVVGPDQLWSFLKESIRVVGSALAFAFAFAAAARRLNASQSLFSEIGFSWQGWIRARSISLRERREQREQARNARRMKQWGKGMERNKKAQEKDRSRD